MGVYHPVHNAAQTKSGCLFADRFETSSRSTLSESRRSQNRLPSVKEGMPDGNVIDIPRSPLRTDDLHLANAKHKASGKDLLLPVTACSSNNNFRH